MEELPSGEPRRYVDGRGYVRLRWKVGVNSYVEAYEHRLVKQFPPVDVHHRDGNKGNNDPANLEALSRSEHGRHHGEVSRKASRSLTEWDGCHSQEAYERRQRAAARRRARAAAVDRMAALYRSGLSTIQVGERLGISHANVYRALRAAGVEMRTNSDYAPVVDQTKIVEWHAAGMRATEMMQRLGIGRKRLYAIFDELGLPRFTGGRPSKAEVR
ncbi:HNH endonuclease [Micromonospora echinospora]|uniref:HNH endonuclease n=1 Tax=Micromonospora echinospora TaxID=1877 RepID=UPI0037B5150C